MPLEAPQLRKPAARWDSSLRSKLADTALTRGHGMMIDSISRSRGSSA